MNHHRLDDLLRTRIGLDPASLGPAALPRAVTGRMRTRGLNSADEYARLAETDAAEWDALVGELVVPETWFFRGGHDLFRHLAAWAVARRRPVRVLSIPCSTGEEAYSVAVAFAEAGLPAGAYTIDGVDLSAEHVRRAETGRFPAYSFRESGADPRPGHFAPAGPEGWEVAGRLRAAVRFRVGNLAAADFLAGEPPFDLILCRNVLIYLTDDTRARVFGHLDRLLAGDGLLVLTAAEADRVPGGRFEPAGPEGLCVYRRTGGRPNRPAEQSTQYPVHGRHTALPPVQPFVTTAATPITPESAPIHAPFTAKPFGLPAATPTADPLAPARALADAGRLDDARAACERLLAAAPTADGYALLGVVHLAAGRADAAAAAFRKALYLDPDQPDARAHAARRPNPKRGGGS